MSSLAERKARLIVHGEAPYNAEPPLARLWASSYLTAADDFYVRSYGDLPEIDADAYRLHLGGAIPTALELSLDGLRSRYAEVTVTATMQCAGNRRADMWAVAPVSGDPWDGGAIGTADWTGVRLGDVLREAGIAEGADLHVAFESYDLVEGRPYGASIPLAKALAPGTLLAFAMNGAPLLPGHGFPLRAVVPGFAGVRSPKWLKRITVQDHPSDNPIQAEDYKLFPPDVTAETADPALGHTINTMPLNAVICEPARGAPLAAGSTRSAATRHRVIAPSCVSTSRVMAGGPGRRRRLSTMRRHTSPGRSGRSTSISPRASMSWRCAPGTRPGKPSLRCRTTPGTTKATSAPRGTACA
ncbi:Protein-methionine-sulfoxide reductase catalytic subunit MsrP [Methylobacterium frigidaeris]|uniref:Protein-methionine-sulfoxide reductase catalytic subunit MsrP n=1 Tax=Methylobacterium frigidaeris TaxID=2038277 RepID=A0AA37HJA7_9HYPH|nr:Protein-methionine-sulfoxide reductase catalytic subunit MsrP [Methylobacterium frigidaeris]